MNAGNQFSVLISAVCCAVVLVHFLYLCRCFKMNRKCSFALGHFYAALMNLFCQGEMLAIIKRDIYYSNSIEKEVLYSAASHSLLKFAMNTFLILLNSI